MKNEALRKFVVSLKRKPQNIAMVVLVISFLVYSLNLTSISNTTAKIQGVGMGFCGFCTMLFSMLSFVCFLNAFPHRKPVNKPMYVLMFVMFAIVVVCDVYYMRGITNALTRADNPIVVSATTAYITKASSTLKAHIAWIAATVVLVVTMPIYSKMLRKIKTSIDVEDNGKLDAIDLSAD